jgi:hypothetical protein
VADKVATAADAAPLWEASIPESFSSEQGLAASTAALDDARAVLQNVKLRFSGTIPPAPWPATPQIVSAQRDMQIVRDYFDTLAGKDTDQKVRWPRSGKVGVTLIAKGRALYAALADLEGRAAQTTTLDELLKLVPRPARLFEGLTGLLLLGGALYLVHQGQRAYRWAEGV